MSKPDISKLIPEISTEDVAVFDVRIAIGRPDLAVYGVDHEGYVRSSSRALVEINGKTEAFTTLSLGGLLDRLEKTLAEECNRHFGLTKSVRTDAEPKG